MCRLYEVEVPSSLTYFAHFVGSRDVMYYTSVESYVVSRAEVKADEKLKATLDAALAAGRPWDEAVIHAYCELMRFETALLIEDLENDIVVFGLSDDEVARILDRINSYVITVKKARELAGDEELRSCYYLYAGADVDRCLRRAREVLGEAER